MKNDVIIVCAEDDFYLGDMLCQEMEARGKGVLFNLRDAHTPDNLGFRYFDNAPIYIAVVNGNFASVKSFMALTTHKMTDKTVESYLFVNEDDFELPRQWDSAILIDANAGWEDDLMDAIAANAVNEVIDTHVASATGTQSSDPVQSSTNTEEVGDGRLRADHRSSPHPTQSSGRTSNNYSQSSEEEVAGFSRHKNDNISDMLLPDPPSSMMVKRALKYYHGESVVKDLDRAYSLLKRAVDEDPEDVEALYYLGVFLERGELHYRNFYKAKDLYQSAVEKGFAPAMVRLACVILKEPIPTPEQDALKIFQQARKAGDVRASYWIGYLSENKGEVEDAFEYYSEAAEEGYAPAQNALGCMYGEGLHVSQDYGKAREWFRMATEQNLPVAMGNLGDIMIRMDGMSDEARQLIRRAGSLEDENGMQLCDKLDQYEEMERQEAIRRRKAAERQEQIESLLNTVGSELGRLFRGTNR